jgi:AAA+ ATPase superfamily predicted ATPase
VRHKKCYEICDREYELDILKKHVKNDINTTLISARRLGKTALTQLATFSLKKMPKNVFIENLYFLYTAG